MVKSGILEVLARSGDGAEPVPIAYLGTGEVLGELALLTGSPRSATARCPQGAELFAVDKSVFLDLMDQLPAFSRNLCTVLARRLEATTLQVPRSSGKQLQAARIKTAAINTLTNPNLFISSLLDVYSMYYLYTHIILPQR